MYIYVGEHSKCFFFVAQQPKECLGRLIVEVSRSHTIRHTHTHTQSRTPLNERYARRRDRYLHNKQQTQEMKIYALSGIRTRNPSSEVDADLRLRPYGLRDWLPMLLLL